jgi:hypothetical protein
MRQPTFLVTAILTFHASTVAASLVLDPIGDTFGTEPIQMDIISYSANTIGGNTHFLVNFNNLIAPFWTGLPNSLGGFLEIDVDKDPSTGLPSALNHLGPPLPELVMGVDVAVVFSSVRGPGLADVLFLPAFTSITVPITFGPRSISFAIPLAIPFGTFNYAIGTSTSVEPSDRAPNGSEPAQSVVVPEPGTALLVTLPALVLFGLNYRRSRARAF